MRDRSEAGLTGRLLAVGLDAAPWSNGPDERYAPHRHGYDKVLVVARGSIVFGLPESGTAVSLEVGERLDLPAGTDHDALVGPAGVTCLEAHLPAGSLGPTAASRGRIW
ncbi:MAG: cupin domain-containing protein [Candidatus Limnocylindrales bacterium]